MASVFTYDPEPPRVSSPWLTSRNAVLKDSSSSNDVAPNANSQIGFTDNDITRLDEEPQDGPIEYKLHLLLRPRRKFSASTTPLRISGSSQSKHRETQSSVVDRSSPAVVPTAPPPSDKARQNRLQNLTTQLLWRLQQSAPNHSTSKSDLVVPNLLGAGKLAALSPSGCGRLLPGLEESQGALYEIGVSDDGAFVGLVRDELEESLSTLRTMAYSLGCKVKLLRERMVGRCQWVEEEQSSESQIEIQKEDALWVAEALVTPDLESQAQFNSSQTSSSTVNLQDLDSVDDVLSIQSERHTSQLRISLTGCTTAGKSSLLGVLATSTLDDGRGKVRKSLHKHLHEIASGVTSSLVTELIGYRDAADSKGTEIINYAIESVSQWTDIHDTCRNGRIVALTDSAGHLKYRRTTVRGLLSCAPHWTFCCIAADNEQFAQGDINKRAIGDMVLDDQYGASGNASKAHLDLCLALGLPLVIVITKLDLASSSGLRKLVGEILTCLKASGRQPKPIFAKNASADDPELQTLLVEDSQEVTNMFTSQTPTENVTLVPLVLTSAVTGAGIPKLHALLHYLPILREPTMSDPNEPHGGDITSGSLFHIDEVFATSDAHSIALLDGSRVVDGYVVSGHLSRASIRLGDICLVGPFDAGTPLGGEAGGSQIHYARSCPSLKQIPGEARPSRSSPRITSESLTNRPSPTKGLDRQIETWRRVKVVSLRNLRLPVRQLDRGHTGTIGIVDENTKQEGHSRISTFEGRIRKGMVMIHDKSFLDREDLPACHGFVATFVQPDAQMIKPGSLVKIYVASIRASGKVLSTKSHPEPSPSDELFTFDETSTNTPQADARSAEVAVGSQQMEATIELQGSREWLELGYQVLVLLERGDNGVIGLNGVVGKIIQLLG